QTANNIGSTAQHMGMYFGWNWTYTGNADTPMLWNNASQKFESSVAKLSISRPSYANQFFRLGDVDNDTWVGVPWAPSTETPIATQAGWIAPLFDFGVINAGGSVNYDLTLVYEFNNATDFAAWERTGDFYVGAQGVQSVVPEPSTFALVGFAFGAVAFVRRRRVA
ncbi:MAG: PEP-CTERM sorting domain-containing protein, partial [Gemmatimonadaceae bacterium]